VPEGADPHPLYVTGLDLASNTLIVGEKDDLFSTSCRLTNVTFTRPVSEEELTDIDVKVRYSKGSVKGTLKMQNEKSKIQNDNFKSTLDFKFWTLDFIEPVRAVTPGQHAVFYREGECLGGGVIIATPLREEKGS
jgi:tRNA-specific 2-thiouridylase